MVGFFETKKQNNIATFKTVHCTGTKVATTKNIFADDYESRATSKRFDF